MHIHKKGSAMILVLISILILSMIGMAGLTNVGTEMSTARNFAADKTAFYAADAGINYGLNIIRDTVYPPDVIFNITDGNIKYKSGEINDTTSQPVKFFNGFATPPPKGISIEEGSETGIAVNPWQLTVSSLVESNLKGLSRKEITLVFQALSPEY